MLIPIKNESDLSQKIVLSFVYFDIISGCLSFRCVGHVYNIFDYLFIAIRAESFFLLCIVIICYCYLASSYICGISIFAINRQSWNTCYQIRIEYCNKL